jgi:hypothetical protein
MLRHPTKHKQQGSKILLMLPLRKQQHQVLWLILHNQTSGELTGNLNSAREALRDNDPAGAVGDLGSAETEVRVFMTQLGGEDSPGGQQLLTVLNHINMAQDSSGNNDILKAFQEINTADTELVKITQKLPADGDGEGDGDD